LSGDRTGRTASLAEGGEVLYAVLYNYWCNSGVIVERKLQKKGEQGRKRGKVLEPYIGIISNR
jgi:hypothetical protein